MGVGIDGPPNTYDAGLEFDYSVWTPGTTVDLVNVPWDNAYKDVFGADSRDARKAYIDGRPKLQFTQMSYAKPGEDIYVNIPFNRVSRYNYLRASNPLMPVPDDLQKDYYYFIIGCEYIAPNNTRLRLQLDVWMTYIDDAQFGNCYVERGHIGIANNRQMWNFGRDYLTVPEGLDLGSELQIIQRYTDQIIPGGTGVICVASTVDLTADAGTVAAPKLNTAKGGRALGVPTGCDIYLFQNTASYSNFMASIADKSWVTQGFISVTVIPDPLRYGTAIAWPASGTPLLAPAGVAATHKDTILKTSWRDDVKSWIPERYRHLNKMLVSPYLGVELTTNQGNAIDIKPEIWANENLEVREYSNPVPPNQKLTVFPKGYNSYSADSSARPAEDTAFAAHMGSFPTMSVVNNMAMGYMASNRNSILYSQVSANWSQQRALAMAQGQFDVASGAIGAARDITGIGISSDIMQTGIGNRLTASQAIIGSVATAVSGVGSALTPGGFGGAAISGIAQGAAQGGNAVVQISANDQALAVRNAQAGQTVGRQNQQASLSRDVNYDLARFAARGDYANAMAAVNARVQDAKMIQPTISGQAGGDILNYMNGLFQIRATIKRIDGAATTIVGEYWLRYGYAIRKFITPPKSLKVMTKFSYWKMLETYIASAMIPEGHKQVLRGMLEKGITVWSDPNDIGMIDIADNDPLEGIAY